MTDILDTRFEGKAIELSENKVSLGDDVNILAKDPALHKIKIGVGWDMNAFDADAPDLDLSLFLIGRDGMTRIDEDFIFYNQTEGCEGKIKHGGDNRTGAGDGDDEIVLIDLHGVPFDVFSIVFTLSIYKGDEKRQELGMIRNVYMRIMNSDNNLEILRYNLEEHFRDKIENAAIVAYLNREGPKWHFKPAAEFIEGGLGAIAKRYGIIITQQ